MGTRCNHLSDFIVIVHSGGTLSPACGIIQFPCAFFAAACVHVPQFSKLNTSSKNRRSYVHIKESMLAQSLVKAMSMLNIK